MVKQIFFYYLSDDYRNEKNQTELDYLSKIGRVVLVTTRPPEEKLPFKHKIIKPLNSKQFLLHTIWRKVCFLICKISDSTGDRSYPVRNIYFQPSWLRWVINFLWSIKKIRIVNKILPVYDSFYFAPYQYYWYYRRLQNKKNRVGPSCKDRIIVYDALLVRLDHLTSFVSYARSFKWKTLAIIKSWDNPFYSQISTKNDYYAVWSKNMAADLFLANSWLKNKPYFTWNARPFHDFWKTVENSKDKKKDSNDGQISVASADSEIFVIGYAAAFCQPILAQQEVRLIINLTREIKKHLPNVKLFFRPYPSVNATIYNELIAEDNIQMMTIVGPEIDRFGDGREKVKFGSSMERIAFLEKCDLFVSLGTSFTIEAAIFGLPIVQFYVPLRLRRTLAECRIFEQFDISDHLVKYYLNDFKLIKSGYEVVHIINQIISKQHEININDKFELKFKRNVCMLEKLGITYNWNNHQAALELLQSPAEIIL